MLWFHYRVRFETTTGRHDKMRFAAAQTMHRHSSTALVTGWSDPMIRMACTAWLVGWLVLCCNTSGWNDTNLIPQMAHQQVWILGCAMKLVVLETWVVVQFFSSHPWSLRVQHLLERRGAAMHSAFYNNKGRIMACTSRWLLHVALLLLPN